MSDLEEELSRLKNLCDEATQGPWKEVSDLPCYAVADSNGKDVCASKSRLYRMKHHSMGHFGCYESDAQFIAESRTAMPRLIKGIETLFDAIKHGDQEHQDWLENKINDHFGQILRGEE